MSNAANRAEVLPQQNLQAWQYLAPIYQTAANRALFVANFNTVWNAYVQACVVIAGKNPTGNAELALVASVQDRMHPGATLTVGAITLTGNGKHDWFAYYLDPIQTSATPGDSMPTIDNPPAQLDRRHAEQQRRRSSQWTDWPPADWGWFWAWRRGGGERGGRETAQDRWKLWLGRPGTHWWVNRKEQMVAILAVQTAGREPQYDFDNAVSQAVIEWRLSHPVTSRCSLTTICAARGGRLKAPARTAARFRATSWPNGRVDPARHVARDKRWTAPHSAACVVRA
jgi:hypothetical protein